MGKPNRGRLRTCRKNMHQGGKQRRHSNQMQIFSRVSSNRCLSATHLCWPKVLFNSYRVTLQVKDFLMEISSSSSCQVRKQPSFSTWSSYTKTYALTAPLRTLLMQMKSMSMNKLESSGFVLNLAFFKASLILKINCKAWCKSTNFISDRLK